LVQKSNRWLIDRIEVEALQNNQMQLTSGAARTAAARS
jgi:hypothetical protein